jgi:phosphatidate phosphatase PAH1
MTGFMTLGESSKNNDAAKDKDKTVKNSSVFTSELNATLSEYQKINRTDGIDVIIQVETTNETKFMNTADNISQMTSIKFIFPNQRLIAANTTPHNIERIANVPQVVRIGIDEKVSASSD